MRRTGSLLLVLALHALALLLMAAQRVPRPLPQVPRMTFVWLPSRPADRLPAPPPARPPAHRAPRTATLPAPAPAAELPGDPSPASDPRAASALPADPFDPANPPAAVAPPAPGLPAANSAAVHAAIKAAAADIEAQRDKRKFVRSPPVLAVGGLRVPLGGIFALPFVAHAAATGKCK